MVTGGGAGIGLACVKELLKNGLKGITIADKDPCKGEEVCRQITREFGENKAIYVKCDVLKSELVDCKNKFLFATYIFKFTSCLRGF